MNPGDLTTDAEEQAALDGMNSLRASAGAPALSLSATLGQAAAWKSGSMASSGIFAHDDPGRAWSQRIAECGYRVTPLVGEDLAWGTETGRATVQIWRDSPAHNRIMMDPSMRAVGIARVRGSSGWYWTADFGAVTDSPAPTITVASPAVPSPSPGPAAVTAPARPGSLQAGASATVNAGRGDCLNVHSAPGRGARITGCLADGATVKIVAGPVTADGMAWWQIDTLGWVSADFLN